MKYTPLHFSVDYGSTETTQLLLQHPDIIASPETNLGV